MSLPEAALKFYSSHGVITDPRDQEKLLIDLPASIPDLCKVVQGLLIHPLVNQLDKVDLTAVQRKEVNLRSAAEILRLAMRLDPRPITEARLANDRVVGN